MAPLVRNGGSRHTGLAAPPQENIHMNRSCYTLSIRDIFKFASRIGNVCSDTGRVITNPSLVVIIIRFLDLYGEMVAVLVDASGIESYRAAL